MNLNQFLEDEAKRKSMRATAEPEQRLPAEPEQLPV